MHRRPSTFSTFLLSLLFGYSSAAFAQFLGFRSDNVAGACPEVLAAIVAENAQSYALPYGTDGISALLKAQAKAVFGAQTEAFVVSNGTAANVLGIAAVKSPYQSVIAGRTSHLVIDEANAPTLRAIRVHTVDTVDGKISLAALENFELRTDVHFPRARVLTVTQPTEYGTVYTLEELRALGRFAREHQMLFHIDGARLSNAAASLGVSLQETTFAVGADVVSFGGTKNGLLSGELVVFRDATLADEFPAQKKSELQLLSKERFVSAQLSALLTGELWKKNASHANAMAQKLKEGIGRLAMPGLTVSRPTQANAVFVRLPSDAMLQKLAALYSFEIWDTLQREIRLMTNFRTTDEEVNALLSDLIAASR